MAGMKMRDCPVRYQQTMKQALHFLRIETLTNKDLWFGAAGSGNRKVRPD